jgi:hypothetical protein
MGKRNWRELKLRTARVPERDGCAWTPVYEFLTPGKTYRLEVPADTADQKWTPEISGECTADGNPDTKRSDDLLLPGTAAGALIAKIGGSTADLKVDKDKVPMFAAGRYCVFTVESGKASALYLGVNDTNTSAFKVTGSITVKLWEAL